MSAAKIQSRTDGLSRSSSAHYPFYILDLLILLLKHQGWTATKLLYWLAEKTTQRITDLCIFPLIEYVWSGAQGPELCFPY